MSTQTPDAGPKKTKSANPKSATPPDERFWVRYSPHHEAPLSGVASLLLHVLGIVAIVLITYGMLRLETVNRQLPIQAAGRSGGGGGSGTPGAGDGSNAAPMEDAGEQRPMTDALPTPEPMTPTDIAAADTRDPVADPNFRPISTKEAREAMAKLGGLQERLKKSLGGAGGDGGSGPGKDGGKDGGRGPGEGDSVGSGSKGDIRNERMNRWTMTFDTRSGIDYVNQLHALGAFLAIPIPGTNPPQYQLIRDLRARPPRLLNEDLSQIKRIFWVDNKPDSVRSLMTALGLNTPVDHFVAFMPPELESKLLRLERAYKGLREDQIEETLFRVVKGSTGFEPRVVSQTRK